MSAGDDDNDEKARAMASTAVGDAERRTPSQQALHDGVKQVLFDGGPRRVTEYDPGTVLAGRYRVVALLGRGGMGEVYRARDLIVDEDVAIKFLPENLAARPAYLERFVQEVRLARQVSHPHVCRVHDIGEADGRRFISMEYIDGEDLASLLRRIGRLGHEKAIELAHQLCSGLAALHERGMIHRDLKPSNIMLDGAGRIRIADFGLASIADELGEHEYRDGTPAYQAPEQIAGREVTTRSDVYALGLVLHEMFLGRRPDGARSDATTALSGLDAGVAEVLERCLDSDPRHRPASALEVAAALPGGDPLSAALAAGRLPSPEAVANAATVGALSRRWGWALVAATLVALVLIGILSVAKSALHHAGEVQEPEVLEHRVEEILRTAGYDPDFTGGTLTRLGFDEDYIAAVAFEHDDPREALQDSEFSPIRLRFRGFPLLHSTQSTIRAHEVELADPYETEVVVDGRGRLRDLVRVPPEDLGAEGETTGGDDDEPAFVQNIEPPPSVQRDDEAPIRTYPWRRLLEEAGFDPTELNEAVTTERPPVYADSLRAWTGSVGDVDVRIHAASLGGQPVWFTVERVGTVPPRFESDAMIPFAFTLLFASLAIVISTLRSAVAVLRRREGDFVGARRLAYAMFGLQVLGWGLNAQGFELVDFTHWFLMAAGTSIAAWLGYLVLEPYARANWPRSLVSWTRVMQGRWRDPMVGRDLLIASCLSTGLAFVMPLTESLIGDRLLTNYDLNALLGVRRAMGVIVDDTHDAVVIALVAYVALLGLQAVVRSRLVALVLFVGAWPTAVIAIGNAPEGIQAAIMLGVHALVMVRFGLLALVAINVFGAIAIHLPITAALRFWWAPTGLLGVALVLVPALLGFVRATAPQRPDRSSA